MGRGRRGRRARAGGGSGVEVSSRVRQVWEAVTSVVALLAGIYLILTTIEPTRLVVERYLGRLDMQGLVALVAVMLEVTTIAVYQLSREVRSLRAKLSTHERQGVTHSLNEVLSVLRRETSGRRRRRVEVLGLTLNTTWPALAAWLTEHNRPSGWRITLYCLDPGFIERSGELPADWAEEARRSLRRIESFLDHEADELKRCGVTVDLRTYECVPIVHGFRFGDDTVFISYLQWTETERIRPFEFYDRIGPEDNSPRAGHYRDLFDNWLARAEAKAGTPRPTSVTRT